MLAPALVPNRFISIVDKSRLVLDCEIFARAPTVAMIFRKVHQVLLVRIPGRGDEISEKSVIRFYDDWELFLYWNNRIH